LSVAEYLSGGLALTTVALIAVSSAHVARPQASVPPVPVRYATAAIDTSEAAAKLSLHVSEPNEASGETRNTRISDPAPGADVATVPPLAPPLPPPAADRASPVVARWPAELDAAGIKLQTIDAGPLGPMTDAVWDLRSPRAELANNPNPDMPIPQRVRAAPTFVGRWADDIGQCRAHKRTPIVISPHAAKTESAECDFGSVAREAVNRWSVAALCTADGQFWRAHIALKLVEPNLTWSSERGTTTYVRCKR
jgi:hypothetical protein